MSFLTLLLIFVVVVVMLLAKAAVNVPKDTEFVIERLGRFQKVLPSGWHLLIPFLERVTYRRSTLEETLPLAKLTVETIDRQNITLYATLTLKVTDSKVSCYKIGNYKFSAGQAAQELLTDAAAGKTLIEFRDGLNELENFARTALNNITNSWGVATVWFKITEIK